MSIKVSMALRLVGGVTAAWAIAFVTAATIAYIVENPDFSFFTTYLSDIGDSAGWPQTLFNSGTLIAAPMRFLFLALVVVCLYELGAGRLFVILVLALEPVWMPRLRMFPVLHLPWVGQAILDSR